MALLAMAQAWLRLAQRAEEAPSANILDQPNSPETHASAPSVGPPSSGEQFGVAHRGVSPDDRPVTGDPIAPPLPSAWRVVSRPAAPA